MKPDAEFDEYDPRFDAVLESVFQAVRTPDEVTSHVDELELTDYVYDRLSAKEADLVRRHVEGCPTCAENLRQTREIRTLIENTAEERESYRVRPQVTANFVGRPGWRFAGAALAMACLAFGAISFRHVMEANRSLGQSASARQRTIDSLQRQLAQKASTDRLVGIQQRQLIDKEKQVAQARTREQSLEAQLTALKDQGREQGDKRATVPAPNPGPPLEQVAKNTTKKDGLPLLNRAVQVALAEKCLPLSKDYQGSMIGAVGVEMGEGVKDSTFNALSPVGTNLLTDNPLFIWTPVENATGYRVIVQNDRGKVLADSLHLLQGSHTTQWQSPPLPRGQILHWSVTAQNGDPQLPVAPKPPHLRALFTVLDKTKADAIQRQAASVADSPKALAVLYAQASLLDDAEREAQAWEMTDPGSGVAHAWLAKLRAYRGEKIGGGKENVQ